MKRHRHTPEQIVRKLREGDRMLNEGKDLTEGHCCVGNRPRGLRESGWRETALFPSTVKPGAATGEGVVPSCWRGHLEAYRDAI